MKKTLSIFSIAILAACSSPEQATGDIAAMSAQKDSLVSVRSELNTQITLLEEQLSKLDTTARYDAVTA